AGFAQVRLDVGQAGALHRGVIAPVIGVAQTFECAGVVAVGKRSIELALFLRQRRNLALQPFAVFGGLTLLLLEFAAPVPVGEDCAGVIYPRRQLVRLLLQRLKLLLGIGYQTVEVGDEAVLAAL